MPCPKKRTPRNKTNNTNEKNHCLPRVASAAKPDDEGDDVATEDNGDKFDDEETDDEEDEPFEESAANLKALTPPAAWRKVREIFFMAGRA